MAGPASKLSAVLKSPGVRWVGLGWMGFIGENLILSEHRDWLMEKYGKTTYHASYSALSSIATGSILYGWFKHSRGKGPMLFKGQGGPVRPIAAFAVQAAGLVMLSQLSPPISTFEERVMARVQGQQAEIIDSSAKVSSQTSTASNNSASHGQAQAAVTEVEEEETTIQKVSKCPVPSWMRVGMTKPKDHDHLHGGHGKQAAVTAAVPSTTLPDTAAVDAIAVQDVKEKGVCPVTHPIAFVSRWWYGGSTKKQADEVVVVPEPEPVAAPVVIATEEQETTAGVKGVWRVTRHVGLWSLGFVCLGGAIATPFAPEAVAMLGPSFMALIGGWHQDRRFRHGSGGVLTQEMEDETSLIPFAALIEGRQSWDKLWEELDATNAQVALALATLLALRRGVRLNRLSRSTSHLSSARKAATHTPSPSAHSL